MTSSCPQEGVTSHNDNMAYINLALRACARQEKTEPTLRSSNPTKRDSDGRIRSDVPFGPCLLPVPRLPPPLQDGGGDADMGPDTIEESPVGTDDLLECLLHPDVVAMVTRLLLDKQRRTPITLRWDNLWRGRTSAVTFMSLGRPKSERWLGSQLLTANNTIRRVFVHPRVGSHPSW